MKHTPGPWFYIKGDEWSHSVATQHGELPDGSQSYWTVASINKQREPEHEANAQLIAAAPELLQALETIRDLHDYEECSAVLASRLYDARNIAIRAIAKVTGENK